MEKHKNNVRVLDRFFWSEKSWADLRGAAVRGREARQGQQAGKQYPDYLQKHHLT